MLVIGLTGNIGTGKSTVAQILRKLGVEVIDADKLGHQLLKPHTTAWRKIVDAFGAEVMRGEEIDRGKLAKIVFADAERLANLNNILHPGIYRLVQERIKAFRKQGAKAVVVEAPLLIEAGWTPLFDRVWATTAPDDVVVGRLTSQKGLARKDILSRMGRQMPQAEKTAQAEVVINTDCTPDELEAKVKNLWQNLLAGRPLPKRI